MTGERDARLGQVAMHRPDGYSYDDSVATCPSSATGAAYLLSCLSAELAPDRGVR